MWIGFVPHLIIRAATEGYDARCLLPAPGGYVSAFVCLFVSRITKKSFVRISMTFLDGWDD